ncbi:MAG: 16S rRNA (adenine(1518)-N(6)/adenine(1519)-N(6))-dimethyltransferase, partial [Rhodococcus sp. (in: high G+C Gram-positive bacteria)]|nr:16S rRNA (adenine(1518)-N(6)/adenine(1519)-N(6))-dimethyltransferase [Rhodococcus sp. (in: high G+C Gram-positive bacteria)]MDX5451165.1 16S rRNA (adenine(1518)-N(6)/adenine(1519)-N(6))-dimethyltransferase [Rhodococcus sp. (in: high G+C Gram-positive bacteria)]
MTARGRAALLGPAEVRALAEEFGVRPTKQLGQNFVHDANTVRRIVSVAGVGRDDVVLEVGPGLGAPTPPHRHLVGRRGARHEHPPLAQRHPPTVAHPP